MKLSDSVPLASGIPLPTDSGMRAGMRRRFLKKARRDEERTLEVGDNESNVLTEPHVRAPAREPTLSLDMSDLEYVDTPSAPMVSPEKPKLTGARREESVLFQLPGEPVRSGSAESSAVLDIRRMAAGILGDNTAGGGAAGRESSVLVSLAALQKIGEGRAEEETAGQGRGEERPALSRESSVALSLSELQHIEAERVAGEMAKECSECFRQLEERLSDLNSEHVDAERGYAASNHALESALVEAVDSLATEYRELYGMLCGAKAKVSLRPGEEGYMGLDPLKAEFDGIWNGINAAILKVDGCRGKVRQAMEALPAMIEADEREAERARAERAAMREPSMEIPVEFAEPEPVAKTPAPAAEERPKGRMGKALSRFATLLGFGIRIEKDNTEGSWGEGDGIKSTLLGFGPKTVLPPARDEEESAEELSLSDAIFSEPEGVPWEEGHVRYGLSDNELIICESTMDERKVYWMLPVPSHDEGNAERIIAKFKDEAIVRLGGKRYYIFPGGEENAFAGAKMASRVGNALHIWPEEMTDYEYLGSLSIEITDKRREETQWPEKMSSYMMSMEECAACNYFLPDNNPRWLHPVPPEDTRNEGDREILRSLSGTPQITLSGRKFYVLNIATVSDWREAVLYLPRTRIVTRHSNWLSVWDEEENGKYMFFNSGTHSSSYYGPKAERSLREAREATVYHSEVLEVGNVFDKMGQVWLYELDDLPRMSANELGWIVKSANSTVQKHGASSLISAEGRWYVALDIFVPDSMRAEFDGSKVKLVEGKMSPKEMLAKMKARVASKSASGQKMSLPPKAGEKKASILALPEGEVRHLLPVDPDFTGELLRPWLPMTVEGRTVRLLILDEPHKGAMAVVRKGNSVFFARIEGQSEEEDSLEIALD